MALLAVGLLLATFAGLSAGQYTPSWFDPDDPLGCATGPDGCGVDGPEAALQGLWWWVGAGALVALVGVALVLRTLDGAPRGGPVRRLPAVVHASGAAGAVPLLLVALVVPAFFLLQGGRPLALQVGPGQTPEGGPAEVQRVGVAPGGAAFALLTWRSYGGWADQETPQAVTVALDASSTLVAARVVDRGGSVPFDIADGGAWGIAPWAPGH
ncbi:hypothetical protein [Modestobacter sp. SYSU DS0290]